MRAPELADRAIYHSGDGRTWAALVTKVHDLTEGDMRHGFYRVELVAFNSEGYPTQRGQVPFYWRSDGSALDEDVEYCTHACPEPKPNRTGLRKVGVAPGKIRFGDPEPRTRYLSIETEDGRPAFSIGVRGVIGASAVKGRLGGLARWASLACNRSCRGCHQ